MKKLFIALCSFFSLYTYGPLERVQRQLSDIEQSLKIVQAEVECGLAVGGMLKKLELERDIVLALMQSFSSILDEGQKKKKISEEKAEKLISSKIDRFLKNMKDGCVRDCFEQKFERIKEIQREIDDKLTPLSEKHPKKSVQRIALKLKKQLEDEMSGIDDQIVLIVKSTTESTNSKKFKCIGA